MFVSTEEGGVSLDLERLYGELGKVFRLKR